MNRFQFSVRALLFASVVIALALAAMVSRSESNYLAVWFCTLVFGVFLFAILSAIFRRGAMQAYWGGFAVGGVVYLFTISGASVFPFDATPSAGRLITTRLLERVAAQAYPHQTTLAVYLAGTSATGTYTSMPATTYVPAVPAPYVASPPAAGQTESNSPSVTFPSDASGSITAPEVQAPSPYLNPAAPGVAQPVYIPPTIGPPTFPTLAVGTGTMPESFMFAGQLLWTLLLGYIGGTVARMFYLRRTAEHSV